MSVCTEILYGSLITVGLVPASYTTTTTTTDAAADAAAGDDAGERVVLHQHPGFTDDSIGYNAESGQSVDHMTSQAAQ